LFAASGVLQDVEYLIQEYKSQLPYLTIGEAMDFDSAWVKMQALDLAFVEEKLCEIQRRVAGTRGLVWLTLILQLNFITGVARQC
jgi:hypothetical protein